MDTPKLTVLRSFLREVSPGAILETETLEGLLLACWDQFTGADSQGMKADKLISRVQGLRWDPFTPRFNHGALIWSNSQRHAHGHLGDRSGDDKTDCSSNLL